MTAATSETLAREYFSAVDAGDRDRLAAVLAPEVIYRFPGRSPFARTYSGRAAVLGYLDRLREVTGGSMAVSVRDVMVGARGCAGWVHVDAQRDGTAFGWDLLALLACGPSGIESIALFYDDQYGVDDFLAERS